MAGKATHLQRYLKDKVSQCYLIEEEIENDMEEEEEVGGVEERKKKVMERMRGSSSSGGGSRVSTRSCQVEKCTADLTEAKQYHRRHRVCEIHAKAPAVIVAGLRQRFCQQCSRFHQLIEFDEAKRSCRRRLAGHNERRRKNPGDNYGEGSSRRGISGQLIQDQDRNRVDMTLPIANPAFKRSQIT